MFIKSLKKITELIDTSMIASCDSRFDVIEYYTQEQLNQYALHANNKKQTEIGYPSNNNIELSEFYKWYINLSGSLIL